MTYQKNLNIKDLIVNKGQIVGLPKNPRFIRDERFAALKKSIEDAPEMLSLRELIVYPFDGKFVVICGNMRLRACLDLGYTEVPCKVLDEATPVMKLREYAIKDNEAFGQNDWDILANEWDSEELKDWGMEEEFLNDTNEEYKETDGDGTKAKLTDRFIEPPFSVLDTRSARWQERKRKWVDLLGDEGGSTREGILYKALASQYPTLYNKYYRLKEKNVSFAEYVERHKDEIKETYHSVSLFDPVLSEILCAWFTPHAGSKIFDPFAGDTRKGLVFAYCGHTFRGIELRQDQVEENRRVIADRGLPVEYVCDDGQNVSSYFDKESQDLLFSCPPYFDLEVYSDLPNDASNQKTYDGFISILRNAFGAAFDCLKNNRFAVIVVSDVRGKDGGYYDFPGDIRRMFKEFGASYINEIIVVNNSGGILFSVQKSMKGRKVTRCHQIAMCFFKGDPRAVRKEFPPIEMAGVEEVIRKEWTDRVDDIESV